ncbi:hypothetical protein GCM10010230_23220 [Streptomyces narbonensis]|nr:hypothetical protein GCM10010230_23220 [Streptomyces narbonensis]
MGQAVGPLISGILSGSEGGIAKGLWLSVILLLVSAVASLFQRESEPAPEPQVADTVTAK